MAATAEASPGRPRKRSSTERDEQVELDPHTRKRRLGAESKEKSELPRRRSAKGNKPQPSRQSARLRERRDLNQQRAGKPATSSPRTVKTRRGNTQDLPRPASKSPKVRKYLNGNIPNPDGKLSGRNKAAESSPKINHGKRKFIKAWLATSRGSRTSATDNENLSQLGFVTGSKITPLSPDDNAVSDNSDNSSMTVKDTEYRTFLSYRKIYIECKSPVGLTRRAREIITGPRSSPEVDETTAEMVKDISYHLATASEDNIIQQLAPCVIPGMGAIHVLDRRLASTANQQWTNFVPIPLRSSLLSDMLPLPRPRPDKTFGYSAEAFTSNQLATIGLLTDQLGRTYAKPDKNLPFPFLVDEFKAQGKGGSHVIAVNQIAGAGAVAMNGLVELARRGSGLDILDYDEPQFFSLSMDHSTVHFYVHWLSVSAEEEELNFHMVELSKHFLSDLDGLRAIHRTVRNILDWALNERLPAICNLLHAYRDELQKQKAKPKPKPGAEAEAEAEEQEEVERVSGAASESPSVEAEPRNEQKQKGRKRKRPSKSYPRKGLYH